MSGPRSAAIEAIALSLFRHRLAAAGLDTTRVNPNVRPNGMEVSIARGLVDDLIARGWKPPTTATKSVAPTIG